MSRILQNGKEFISGDEISMGVIFNNLIGRNMNGGNYRQYIECVAIPEMGFEKGRIELEENGETVRFGNIK